MTTTLARRASEGEHQPSLALRASVRSPLTTLLMANPRPPAPQLLVVAVFGRHAAAFDWARERLQQAFGPVGLPAAPSSSTKRPTTQRPWDLICASYSSPS